jgi:ABC transporter with metal-binding/Fe-S-binding domain ATP-binding protein
MKVASLFSGGKDSTHALYLAQQMGWEVEWLITIVPQADSMMFHYQNIGLTELHSETLDIPLVRADAGPEDELDVLEDVLGDLAVDGLVLGAIASDYQHTRINDICHRIGLRTFAPMWRKDQEAVLRDEVKAGFEIVMVGVSAEGLTEDWLGRILSEGALEELVGLSKRTRFNVSGEGGEYETLVVDGPNFGKRLRIKEATTEWDGMRGTYRVEKASLVDKTKLI